MSQSTFLLEAPPASRSPSPESALGWTIRVATWPSNILRLLDACGPVGWYSRTCPASCPPTTGGTLAPSSGSWANAGMGSPTEFLTLSLPEFHSAAAACSLSAILETGDVPQRYFLSPKACAGVLRRAAKRGKELPIQLHRALLMVAQRTGGEAGAREKTTL